MTADKGKRYCDGTLPSSPWGKAWLFVSEAANEIFRWRPKVHWLLRRENGAWAVRRVRNLDEAFILPVGEDGPADYVNRTIPLTDQEAASRWALAVLPRRYANDLAYRKDPYYDGDEQTT